MDRGRDEGCHGHIIPVKLSFGHFPLALGGVLWEHPPEFFFVLLLLVNKKHTRGRWGMGVLLFGAGRPITGIK